MDAVTLAAGAVLGTAAVLAVLATARARGTGATPPPSDTTVSSTDAEPTPSTDAEPTSSADEPTNRSGPHRGAAGTAARPDGGEREPKLVMAYIRPDRLDDVKEALADTGAPSLTVTQVSGRGSQPAKEGQWRGEQYTVDLHRKVKVECVVADVPVDDVVSAIADAAHTGRAGDGKVFVLPVESALQIRTGKRGGDAV